MNIAHIENGTVVNIEVASQEWLDEHAHDAGVTYVPYTDDQPDPPQIGLGWDAVTGFEQPHVTPQRGGGRHSERKQK